jgi:hypothetical protein
MFTLFEPVPLSSRAPNWAAKASNYADVFGFSAFGDLFLCSSDGTRIALLQTARPELISLKFQSREEFAETFLKDENVLQSVFRVADYNSIVERLCAPAPEDCFYPVPYPAIGGSGKLDTYRSGNVWVYLSIYAQTLGI